jgi:2-oxoglutarate dehydrogenase E2 component (dihydrolipoamide succinyltransferase)
MKIEIKAPAFPESVADGEVSLWHKQEGDFVARDELLVEIETDKVVMEVVAPEDGRLDRILVAAGSTIESDALLAELTPGASGAAERPTEVAQATASVTEKDIPMGPAARQLIEANGLDATAINGTGKDGRINKEDVVAFIAAQQPLTAASSSADVALSASASASASAKPVAAVALDPQGPTSERIERRVPMTRMRARIAERLLAASQETAMLTTFNEVDMAPLMRLRSQYKDQFEKTHNGTRLGFMGFFVRACCEALKRFPEVNASIDGNDVVYHGYQDIGVAVSTDDGLVVPVLRDADFMSIADVEAAIRDLGLKARDKKLTIDDMTGGTFTVSNGGVFGSLLSTPILNPPQTAILGMHTIKDRPVAIDGEVVVRPMMYLALSYDHRLIDGKTAVQFLVTVKDLIEDPSRILLQL